MEIADNLRKHVAVETPVRAKMAVARGLLPVAPKTLLAMQYILLGDASEDVAGESRKAILGLPEDRLVPLLDRKTHPKLLEFLAYERAGEERLAEAIALSHQINDKTLCYLAESGTSRICEIVAGNHERLIITPQIRLFLQRNENAGKALVDRVRSFQRLYGIDLPELDEVEGEESASSAQVPAEPTSEPPSSSPPPVEDVAERSDPLASEAAPGPIWAEPVPSNDATVPFEAHRSQTVDDALLTGEPVIPDRPDELYEAPPGLLNPILDLLNDWGIAADPNFVAAPDTGPSDVAGMPLIPTTTRRQITISSSTLDLDGAVELTGSRENSVTSDDDLSGSRSLAGTEFTFGFQEDEASFEDDFVDPNYDDNDVVRQSLQKKLSFMSMADKIKLAYKGNKSARELLVRDPNKIIGVAVVKSGRITDTEIMTIASNRSINEDVIRALTDNREYLRKYPVKLALANNPKTPIPTTMGLLNSLHVNDLKKLANNRNVSSAVFIQANKLYKARKSGQR